MGVVSQKLSSPAKGFTVRGDLKAAALFGQWLWPDGGRKLVITEGEIDALTVSQVQDHKWPVVSLKSGVTSARKDLSKALDWLLQFDEIILMFDDDEPGQREVEKCAPLFPAGKLKVARIKGYKDANEALLANDAGAITKAIWDAKGYRPDGVVAVSDIKERTLQAPEMGLSWPWETLTELTYGRQRGRVYTLGAGTGVGKTDVWTQTIAHILTTTSDPVGTFYLEQAPTETLKRIAGKQYGQRFHVPDAGWTDEELVLALDELEGQNKLFMYDCFGSSEWPVIATAIRFLRHEYGVKDIFIDHLTALADTGQEERGSLEQIMKEIAMLAQELDITIYLISHLATPEGKPHEEGGRVFIRHMKGSRAIGYWSHYVFALERNQQAEDEDARHTTTFRVLKDRMTGQATGEVFYLKYDADTGLLNETEPPPPDFKNEQPKSQGSPKSKGEPF